MIALLSQVHEPVGRGGFGGYGLGQILIAIVIIAALAAIVFLALKHMGIAVPQYIYHVGWILLVAFIAIVAIRFLLTM